MIPPPQAQSPLEAEVTIAQTEAILGTLMTWHITLVPQEQSNIHSVKLQSGDRNVWGWPDGNQILNEITSTVVLHVSAVPLSTGNLNPILQVHYLLDNEHKTMLVVSDTPVQVTPIETYIDTSITVKRGTIHYGESLPIEIWIRNNSTFTLEQVQLRGIPVDLKWDVMFAPVNIGPNTTFHKEITPTITGQHPQPQLKMTYRWVDAMKNPHEQAEYISSEMMTLEKNTVESLFGRIPNEVFGIIIGLIAGALTGFVGDWVSQTLQQRINRRHMHGLLRMATMQSQHAADNSIEVDLKPLETIFTQEGLYAIVIKDKLDQNVLELWQSAKRHNAGLSQSGGLQRVEELRNAAREVEKKLGASR